MPKSERSQQVADSLLSLLQEQGELSLLPAIVSRLQAELDRQAQHVKVISAVELNSDQRTKITEALGVEQIEFVIDPKIMGGLVVERAGRRLDLSLKRNIS